MDCAECDNTYPTEYESEPHLCGFCDQTLHPCTCCGTIIEDENLYALPIEGPIPVIGTCKPCFELNI